jgi:hypothetical protein
MCKAICDGWLFESDLGTWGCMGGLAQICNEWMMTKRGNGFGKAGDPVRALAFVSETLLQCGGVVLRASKH